MSITASDIAALRAKTGAGMMDCKKALEDSGGDTEKAIEELRKKGITKAAKRAGKIASEGLVASYIHGAGKIGVLLEVNCETDFVAKTDKFKDFVNEIGMHIAATSPTYLSREDVLVEELEKEKEIYRGQMQNEGKPAEIIEKIIAGKISKYYGEVCLLEQPFIKDEDSTIEQVLVQVSAEIGEKITIRRFARYELGEGLEKKSNDFVAEVAEQMGQ